MEVIKSPHETSPVIPASFVLESKTTSMRNPLTNVSFFKYYTSLTIPLGVKEALMRETACALQFRPESVQEHKSGSLLSKRALLMKQGQLNSQLVP